MIRDLRLALRTVLRLKSTYLSAAFIIALGIGMCTAMFALVDAVLLRPLPFPDQDRLEIIWKTDPLAGSHVEELAYPELADIEQNVTEFESVALMPTSLYGYARVLRNGNAEPVQIEGTPVSRDFFKVLGVGPRLGRDFTANDDSVGAAPVVILSDRVWRAHLGADPSIVNRMIQLNGEGYTVIGVMPESVEFPLGAGLWFPLGVTEQVHRRGATFLQAIARLKPGANRTRAIDQIRALFQNQIKDHPGDYSPSQQAVVTSLVEYWTGSARLHLKILLFAALLLFIAATISSTNLLLSRALARQHEIVTRFALGAGRRQVLSQLGAEGFIVGLIAVAGGLTFAAGLTRLIIHFAPADIPRLASASLDPRSFAVAAIAALIAIAGCALLPGSLLTRLNLDQVLRESGSRSSASKGGTRARHFFILTQSAVTFALLAVAALLVLSYRAMTSVNTGFANRDAVTMNLQLRGPGLFASAKTPPESRRLFYTQLLNRLRESPGVESAGAALVRPLEGPIGWDWPYLFEFQASHRDPKQALPKANFEVITPGYLATVGTRLIEGRDFNEHDTVDAPPVAIISDSLAAKIRAAGHSPVGHRLQLRANTWTTIVGVTESARYRTITQTGDDLYVPYTQAQPGTNYLAIRGRQSPQELTTLVRKALAGVAPDQAIASAATIGELADRNAARHKFNMILLLWFAACAMLLAAAGVFSIVTETMAGRRREVAIRTALGAQRIRLATILSSRTLAIVVAGEAIGLACVILAGAFMSGLLYGIKAADPWVLATSFAFLLAISALAAFVPAWHAAGKPVADSLR